MSIEKQYVREVADVKEALERARDGKRGCTLLVGAGCSVSGRVPTAPEIVSFIHEHYPRDYERAAKEKDGQEPSYADCMAALTPGDRRKLIADFVDDARSWELDALGACPRLDRSVG